MKILKTLVIFSLGVIAGIGVAITGHRLHNHINFAKKPITSKTTWPLRWIERLAAR